MNLYNTVVKSCISAAALLCAVLLFRHAISEAVRVVIASQPPPAKVEPVRISTWDGCGLQMIGRPTTNSHHCELQLSPPSAESKPIPTMSKEQSETASFWFIVAALAFPLALGAAALIGFVLFRSESAAE